MILIFVLFFAVVMLPIIVFYLGEQKKERFKATLVINIVGFFGVLIFSTLFMFSNIAVANPMMENIGNDVRGMAFLSAAIVTGLCTIGTGIATGQAAQAALAAISENENLMGKSLIFVALAEGIAIYGLLIAFTILGRV